MVIRYDDLRATVIQITLNATHPDCPTMPGSLYNYGIGEPHYPVPAIPVEVTWDYCFCLGMRTRLHVLWWCWIGHWSSVKAIQADC